MSKQKEMALLGNINIEVKDLPENVVAMCRCHSDAIRLCMRMATVYRTQEDWAEILGIDKAQLCMALSYNPHNPKKKRAHHFPGDKVGMLQRLAGNKAVTQWINMDTDGLLDSIRERYAKADALEREAARLRMGA